MKKEVAKRWIRALRSGKYGQTKGKMSNVKGTHFCCLGVLTNEYCRVSGEGFDDVLCYIRGETDTGPLETDVIPNEVLGWSKGPNNLVDIRILKLPKGNNKIVKVVQKEKIRAKARVANSMQRDPDAYLIRANRLLASFNDAGVSFKTIADFIELNWELL